MESVHVLRQRLAGQTPPVFSRWYPDEKAAADRYLSLLSQLESAFGHKKAAFFSAPGRCEIIGNHTDHQGGRVVAAAICQDIAAAAAPNQDRVIRVLSQGFSPMEVGLDELSPKKAETGFPAALIRGTAAGLSQFGFAVSGFDAVLSTTIPAGAGLSSSAAFSCLIGTILNTFSCHGAASPVQIAQAGQKAEMVFFGKSCGLMDQLSSAVGGFAAMDFDDPFRPKVEKHLFSLSRHRLRMFAVHTGGSHAGLTDQYAAIPAEMRQIAAFFGKEILRHVPEDRFYDQLPSLRQKVYDRAICRAMHFFSEDRRAARFALALTADDAGQVLALIGQSGLSSQTMLQNIWPDGNPQERGLSLALALSQRMLDGKGACRVLGGGFAGSILALVPEAAAPAYQKTMEETFGAGSCLELAVREEGACPVPLMC